MKIFVTKKYSIFLSYRRDGALDAAKHLHDSLVRRGYSVFFDLDSLRAGSFDKELYNVIESCTDFLLLLPAHGLDRCEDNNDWVRLEIAHANDCNKNIIPIILPGFVFPETLPKEINFIRYKSGLSANVEYYDAFVKRIETFLKTPKPIPLRKKLGIVLATALLSVVFAIAGYRYFTSYPRNQSQIHLVQELLSYMTLNLRYVDLANGLYQKGLTVAQRFIEGEIKKISTDVRYEISQYYQQIASYRKKINTQLPVILYEQNNDNHFNMGDLIIFPTALDLVLENYLQELKYVQTLLVNEGLSKEHKLFYLNALSKLAKLEAVSLYYNLCETLRPVTVDEFLTELKTKSLPSMTFIFESRPPFTRDLEEITMQENSIFEQQKRIISEILERIGEEEDALGDYSIEWVSKLVKIAEATGLDVSDLTKHLSSIREKKLHLQEMKEQEIATNTHLEEAQTRLYEKLHPLDDDSKPILWGKGTRFLTVGMTREAQECFRMYAQKSYGDERLCSENAVSFAAQSEALGLKGGVVIFMYEPGRPHQKVEIGDIIYAVDGVPVRNITEYEAAIGNKKTITASIIRFNGNNAKMVEATIDSSHGHLGLMGLIDEPMGQSNE